MTDGTRTRIRPKPPGPPESNRTDSAFCASGRSRTGTPFDRDQTLNLARLPIPPLTQKFCTPGGSRTHSDFRHHILIVAPVPVRVRGWIKDINKPTGLEPAVTDASKPFGLPSHFYRPLPVVPPISRRGFNTSPSRFETIFERVRGIEPPSPAWKAGALTVELHPLIKESTHSSGTNPHPPLRRPYFVPRHSAWLFGRHGIYRKSSVLLSNTVMFPTYGVFFLDSFERHIGIEPTSPAWEAGTLTVVLMPLVKHTRTDRIRTGTDCRIKTFRSTVLLLQGTHPLPLLMQFVAGVYPFPLTVLVCFVLLGGIEPPTSCVSDRCSKPTELQQHSD